jgi:azurin
MKIKSLTALAGLTMIAAARLGAAGGPIKDVEIIANDQMKFSVTHIDAHPGETIHVVLSNTGTMPKTVMGHNWVLLTAGTDPNTYANAAGAAAGENYQPKAHADQVLASIPLLGPKKEGEVTFDAPLVPGKYFYLCSFPGHCQAGMRGELVVK